MTQINLAACGAQPANQSVNYDTNTATAAASAVLVTNSVKSIPPPVKRRRHTHPHQINKGSPVMNARSVNQTAGNASQTRRKRLERLLVRSPALGATALFCIHAAGCLLMFVSPLTTVAAGAAAMHLAGRIQGPLDWFLTAVLVTVSLFSAYLSVQLFRLRPQQPRGVVVAKQQAPELFAMLARRATSPQASGRPIASRRAPRPSPQPRYSSGSLIVLPGGVSPSTIAWRIRSNIGSVRVKGGGHSRGAAAPRRSLRGSPGRRW